MVTLPIKRAYLDELMSDSTARADLDRLIQGYMDMHHGYLNLFDSTHGEYESYTPEDWIRLLSGKYPPQLLIGNISKLNTNKFDANIFNPSTMYSNYTDYQFYNIMIITDPILLTDSEICKYAMLSEPLHFAAAFLCHDTKMMSKNNVGNWINTWPIWRNIN